MKAAEIVEAVRRRFGAESDGFGPEWAALDEFCRVGGWSGSRADLFLVRAWAGKPKGHERVLVEVKVSRSDLLAELARPEKMADLGRYAHRWYFAAPVGLVKPTDNLGEGIGLLEVRAGGSTHEARKAARRDAEPLDEDLIVEAFRRASRAEARIRDRARADAAATEPNAVQLGIRLAETNSELDKARDRAVRDRDRLQSWLRKMSEAGGVPCVCGANLSRAVDPHRWTRKHADGTECPERYGASVDVDALAARLGIDAEVTA